MDECEIDQESALRAERLSARMVQDLKLASEKGSAFGARHARFSDRSYVEEAEGTPIGDVVANVDRLAAEFALARRGDGKVLCLKLPDGEIAPISMSALCGWSLSAPYGSENWIAWWEKFFDFPLPTHPFWREFVRQASKQEEQFVVVDMLKAEDGVGRGLNRFLAYRFAGMKKWGEWIQGIGTLIPGGKKGLAHGKGAGGSSPPPPPAVGPGGGLQIQVSCLTPGLRLHVAPAYFIHWVFFGSPTTPVTGYVLPGRYVFAGDGPMLPTFIQDVGVFCIPPTYHPVLTRF